MKTILSMFFALSFSAISAQSLMIGHIPLEEVDTDYLELRVIYLRPLNATQYYAVHYGQGCMNQVLQLQTRSFLDRCTGLKDADGNLVEGFHYSKALTILNRAGWELIDVTMESSEGDSSSGADSAFLLKRKE